MKPVYIAVLLIVSVLATPTVRGAVSSLGSGSFTNQAFEFTVSGTPKARLAIEASTLLTPGSWTHLGQAVLQDGKAVFTDAAAQNFTHRFYRAKDGANCSTNVLGFVRLTIPPGLTLIANPLDTGSNVLSRLIPTMPDGTQFSKHQPGLGWNETYTYDDLEPGWLPGAPVTLNPGEGGMLRNHTSTNLLITFVGNVLQGSLTNHVTEGFSVRSAMLPIQGTVSSILGCSSSFMEGDAIHLHRGGKAYTTFTYNELEASWAPSDPVIGVGEAFLIRSSQTKACVRTLPLCE